MFTEDDWFSFHKEIMDVVDTFIEEYQARRGEFDNELEKGLVVSFALGALKVDLDEIWEALSNAPIFEGISPKELFERGDYKVKPVDATKAGEALLAEMRSRGWVQ